MVGEGKGDIAYLERYSSEEYGYYARSLRLGDPEWLPDKNNALTLKCPRANSVITTVHAPRLVKIDFNPGLLTKPRSVSHYGVCKSDADCGSFGSGNTKCLFDPYLTYEMEIVQKPSTYLHSLLSLKQNHPERAWGRCFTHEWETEFKEGETHVTENTQLKQGDFCVTDRQCYGVTMVPHEIITYNPDTFDGNFVKWRPEDRGACIFVDEDWAKTHLSKQVLYAKDEQGNDVYTHPRVCATHEPS